MFNDYGNNYNTEPAGAPDDGAITGRARIKVIGVGGAGNNAVNRMLDAHVTGAEYYVVNTDSQILAMSPCENKIQIGKNLTKGLGAGADPDIGRQAAEESIEELTKAVEGTDLLFITAGMGGGTGTGAAPIIAKIAREQKILTVAVVTEPFGFEGKKRKENTVKGIDNLKKFVDTLIVIPNDKIKTVIPKNTPMTEALKVADEILKQGIKGLTELIVNPSLINLDFADVRTILKDKGIAHLGVGVAKGENRIIEAVRVAVNCPLLQTTIEGARGVILNVVGGQDLTFDEVSDAAELVRSVVDASANIIFGARIDPNVHDEVEITVIATGFPGFDNKQPEEQRKSYPRPMFNEPASQGQGRMSVTGPYSRLSGQYPSNEGQNNTPYPPQQGYNPAQGGRNFNQAPQTGAPNLGQPYGQTYVQPPVQPVQYPANPQQPQQGGVAPQYPAEKPEDKGIERGNESDNDRVPPFVKRLKNSWFKKHNDE